MHPHSAAHTAVLADPYPIWLQAIADVMRRIGVEVVGSTSSPDEALELVEELRPELLVTELFGSESGLEPIAWLQRASALAPELKTIVLSGYDEPSRVDAAFEAGVVAYVVKRAHPDDVAAAFRQAFTHSIYLPRSRPVGASAAVASTAAPAPDDKPPLTRRELEILQLVAEGHSNAQLAKMLWVTEQTVKFHLSNVYRKLDVSNRTEASRWAQVRGLLPSHAVAGAA